MLKAVPSSWVNQYNLTHSTLPKSPRQLLPDLENIERVMNEKRAELDKARAKDSAALAGAKSSPKKRASTGSSERVPKKARTAKFYQHCKNNGGPYTSHNNKECCKYDKDGKAVAASAKKPYKKKPYKKHEGGDDKQIAYLTDAIESLVKKGLKKIVKKNRKKRSRNDSSSNSNSKEDIGCSDMGLHVDKRLKLDKPLGLNLMSTEPRPIKVSLEQPTKHQW